MIHLLPPIIGGKIQNKNERFNGTPLGLIIIMFLGQTQTMSKQSTIIDRLATLIFVTNVV
jgi:hypothetical protein